VAALVCPRPLFIEVGTDDELCPPEGAEANATRVREFYMALDISDRFVFHEHADGHRFASDDAGLAFLLQHL